MEDFFGNYGTWILFGGLFVVMMFMHRGHGQAGGGCCGGGSREPQKREDSKENVDVKGSSDRPTERPKAGSCH